ncbi:unnamed protein product [Triticum turgidum subsp. durum]|uniref:RRM domain-containing protein n=1 Tax=Triticum turgidum subsp. durum TaxID=4567 RepID=A0A9R0ZBU7_TRITD|nr:unnamed protein product [Triticum turgidum subsp. durum]
MSSDPRNPNPPPPPPPGSSSSALPAGGSYFPLPFHLQQQQPVATYQYQQLQQAQQLFQRDAQTITPEALESVKAALATSDVLDPSAARASASSSDAAAKKKTIPRRAAGQSWEDPTLTEWPENDYRLFCGDLGNEVNDDVLSKAFSRFPSFNMAKGCPNLAHHKLMIRGDNPSSRDTRPGSESQCTRHFDNGKTKPARLPECADKSR